MSNNSIWKKLENKDTKIKYQLEITEKNVGKIISCYYSNNFHSLKIYSNLLGKISVKQIFDIACNKIFDFSNFGVLLNNNTDYEDILNLGDNGFDFKSQIAKKSLLLDSLEFFYNIFKASSELLNSYNLLSPQQKWPNDIGDLQPIIYEFKKVNYEINKLIKLLGYSFVEFDNPNKEHFTWKIYNIIKDETVNLITKTAIEKKLKDILLELSVENYELENLQINLINVYHNYLENNKEDIKNCFGDKIYKRIFRLYDDIGILKHKKPIKVERLNKVDQEHVIDALIWLKDMIIFYFTCFNGKTADELFDIIQKNNLEETV